MDKNILEQTLNEALANENNQDKANAYIDSVIDFCNKNELSTDVVSIIVRGMRVDEGSNFFDFLTSLSKKKLEKIWPYIRDCRQLKDESTESISFAANLLFGALTKEGSLGELTGKVITLLVRTVLPSKVRATDIRYKEILLKKSIEALPEGIKLPEWVEISSATPETIYEFTSIFIDIIETSVGENKYRPLVFWLNTGRKRANDQIEEKNLVAKVPESKIKDLTNLVEHYTEIEKSLKNAIFSIAALEKQIKEKDSTIEELQKTICGLRNEIRELNDSAQIQNAELESAMKEVAHRKQLNQAQVQYREDSLQSMLHEIARTLKGDYDAFMDTLDDDVDTILGEMYRDQIQSIYAALIEKGVRVDK